MKIGPLKTKEQVFAELYEIYPYAIEWISRFHNIADLLEKCELKGTLEFVVEHNLGPFYLDDYFTEEGDGVPDLDKLNKIIELIKQYYTYIEFGDVVVYDDSKKVNIILFKTMYVGLEECGTIFTKF